jgi:hypothetical protein
MRQGLIAAVLGVALLGGLGQARAQGQVEIETAPSQLPYVEIAPQGPATREATRPAEADFYREDIRVRHEPAFIEPFVTKTKGGTEVGLSGWTSPNMPVGSLASQGYGQTNGWFSLGITFVWDSPARAAGATPAKAPR